MNIIFSRWWGPPVGALGGGYVTFDTFSNHPEFHSDPVTMSIYGLLGGALCGCLILLVDPPLKTTQSPQGDSPYVSGSLIGRSLSIIGLLLSFIPPLGIAVSLAALIMNWRVKGWPKTVAWIGFGISMLFLLMIFACLMLAKAAVPPH